MQTIKNNPSAAASAQFPVQLAEKIRKEENSAAQLSKIEFRSLSESYPVRKYSLDDNGGGYQGL